MKFELDGLVIDLARIDNELADPSVYGDPSKLKELMQKKKSLEPTLVLYKEYKLCHENITEAKNILATESDQDMLDMAKSEIISSEKRITELEELLKVALLPKDPNDDRNVIVEVRAGTGGEEAALFAGELSMAYRRFAEEEGYTIEILDTTESETGGAKEVIMKIAGSGAYSKFKYEAGTHRVQRIPTTENKGRVHTSAATVAVLPEADEVDVVIRDEDLDIQTCRSGGAGGQNVNKVESAIRMVHLPSGIVVECQDERSQLKNKQKALKILRSRVFAMEQEKQNKAISAARLAQVGSGDRSEKIRTYNFPQDRVTDHRIGQNFSNIPAIMLGKIGPIIEALSIADQTARLEELNKASEI